MPHHTQVLTHLDRTEIPSGNILPRWTKICDNEGTDIEQLQHLAAKNEELKRHTLLRKAFEIENNRSSLSNYNFNVALQALTATQCSTKPAMNPNESSSQVVTISRNDIPRSWPASTYKGGRLQNTALKSWVTSTKENNEKQDVTSRRSNNGLAL
ncbi:unnamed protein product [Urochloa decumbens]|uniref:Uncharacterized protein n=1 Tax=Urochloa decumbens TaxID=240449 RepID=A0ABC9BXK8_9POAL